MSSPPLIHTTPASTSLPSHPKKWHASLTLDTLLSVLYRTLLNPGLSWLLVLSLRAQVTPTTDPVFIGSVAYAVLLTALFVLKIVNQRVAHGVPRAVDFASEVIVVTGGASGLGLAIAQMYAMRGASVAVLDVAVLDDERYEEVFGAQGVGEGVKYYRCDVGDRKAVEDTRGMIEDELGTPTILINCAAARINGKPLLSLNADAFEKTIRTNLLAGFHVYQIFLPGMLSAENGGTIVTVSSVLGQLCPTGLSDYAASKAGLSALHRTVEAEIRAAGQEDQVKMLLVETGQIATPLFDWVDTPNSFFAPVLEPVQVAREIVATVDGGRGGVLRLPAYAKLANWFVVLPAAVQRIARFVSGMDDAVAKGASSQGQATAASERAPGGAVYKKRA
ncbi:hypothetical protein N7474_004009 [Penicillium riverlandense]|uniref:uncharacterized protein n=1 Tax=Penicillium riverlandense TaxID=1903569 RepID=UPI0025486D18|nr:uncharacterized protein N7474_004009 [Penicillium riverlandense]KAJ5818418.1 hypothetical protein N7474_004009 [Penicillium riverlandense]